MRVYALTGVPPEIQAYAMAKYSRSSASMRESIAELSSDRASEFLETFYFQYGHRSIADMAHVALAIEEISIRAAIDVVDEPLWDGQERSTRYQDFRKSGYVIPDEFEGPARDRFVATVDRLFAAYHQVSRSLLAALEEAYPAPVGSDPTPHRRTLRARAFDVARYLLPMATRTSVGQITSARVLERQIGRLRASLLGEARRIGDALRQACSQPTVDVAREQLRSVLEDVDLPSQVRERLESYAPAPTLVRYADATPYERDVKTRLGPVVAGLLRDVAAEQSPTVNLAEQSTLQGDLLTGLLYSADEAGHSWRQVQNEVERLPESQRTALLEDALGSQGPHDEWPRAMRAGGPLTFDLLIDIGAFRDLHRHRRCTQIVQPFTAIHGYGDLREIVELGMGRAADAARAGGAVEQLRAALDEAGDTFAALSAVDRHAAAYVLPLGYRVRAAFSMDLAEAAYIIELRTKPGGHFSYRHAAWQMYEALRQHHPEFAPFIRATDPRESDVMLAR